MRLLGLDLKPARSGIAMNYDADTGEERLSVTAVGEALTPLHTQIRVLERAILHRVISHRPDVAFIEGTFSRAGGSDYGQHAAHFAVTHVLWARGVPWVDVSPGVLKIWATGSGSLRGDTKVTKGEVIAAVIGRYGPLLSIPAVDDECDAVALMSLGAYVYGHPLLPDVQAPAVRGRAAAALRKTKGVKIPALPGVSDPWTDPWAS